MVNFNLLIDKILLNYDVVCVSNKKKIDGLKRNIISGVAIVGQSGEVPRGLRARGRPWSP